MPSIEALRPWQMGPDYPRWSEALRDGSHVLIRPVCKQDATAERVFIEALSPQSRRYRFLGQVSHSSDDLIKRFTDIDYEHELASAALAHEDSRDRIVTLSRYSTNADETSCECAVTVLDDWQDKGLGTLMLTRLIEVARSRGIKHMWSMDSAGNVAMADLAHHMGFQRNQDPEDSSQMVYSLWL